jgi:hypothetical protein
MNAHSLISIRTEYWTLLYCEAIYSVSLLVPFQTANFMHLLCCENQDDWAC